jgi:hypothetical protein
MRTLPSVRVARYGSVITLLVLVMVPLAVLLALAFYARAFALCLAAPLGGVWPARRRASAVGPDVRVADVLAAGAFGLGFPLSTLAGPAIARLRVFQPQGLAGASQPNNEFAPPRVSPRRGGPVADVDRRGGRAP